MEPESQTLTGKVALVTGAARRIGAAIARCLHGQGMNVAIHYNSSRRDAETLLNELNASRKASTQIFQADLRDTARIQEMVAEVAQAFGRIDVLVNNASNFYATPLGGIDAASFDDLVSVNMKAPLFLAQAAAPHLQAQDGCIVNIADIYAIRPLARYPVYCAAKAALIMLTRSLAHELAPRVRVNAVAPGAIFWPEGDTNEAARAKLIASTPLKREGSPEEIAATVAFLVAHADYMTGEVIKVDGGRAIG